MKPYQHTMFKVKTWSKYILKQFNSKFASWLVEVQLTDYFASMLHDPGWNPLIGNFEWSFFIALCNKKKTETLWLGILTNFRMKTNFKLNYDWWMTAACRRKILVTVV